MSRQSMLHGLLCVPGAIECLPFVRMFYSEPSEYVWHDSGGVPHIVRQAEGGEQGDPLMPALLGQHPALQAAHNHLREETLVAFLDCSPPAGPVEHVLAHQKHTATCASTRGRRECGTRRAKCPGTWPAGMPDLCCWVGAGPLPNAEQGLTLGVPLGSATFVRTQLQAMTSSCSVCPSGCARRIAQLPLSLGGLGLMSAAQTSVSAYWAPWADCLPVLGQHLPPAALSSVTLRLRFRTCRVFALLPQHAPSSAADWTPPSWRVPAPTLQEDGPSTFARGWQGAAASAVARRQCERLLSTLDPSSEAMLRSQQGPFANRFFQRYCRCRRPFNSLGDHRAACARAGVLRSRGRPLERVCREAGARVTCNTRLADMNLQVDRVDDRRLEVVANGLPLWGRAAARRGHHVGNELFADAGEAPLTASRLPAG